MVICREIALNVINKILQEGAYSNIILNNELKKASLDEKDKSLVTQIVYGTVKYKYTIDIILDRFIKRGVKSVDSHTINILRMSIFQLKYLDKIPDYAIVNEAVVLGKASKSKNYKFINAVLRNYLRSEGSEDIKFDDRVKSLAFKYSFDEWMVKLFLDQYEDYTEPILQGLNFIPKLTVRINTMKANKVDITNSLTDCGYVVIPGYASNSGISIENGGSIERNPFFNKGLITPQDESAILVSEALELSKDMVVMDMCSAPGGKTTNIGEILCNTGKIYAFDLYEKKLSLIKENANRLGLTNIICKKADSTKYQEEFNNIADRVLLDVPCSGLGIIRKKPEIKWFKTAKDLEEIIKTQRLILINSAKYVKENGILFYSTCTLNKYENEENIKWFLENHKDFILDKLDFGALPNIIYNPQGSTTILPNEFMDGFFMAKIRRKSGCNN